MCNDNNIPAAAAKATTITTSITTTATTTTADNEDDENTDNNCGDKDYNTNKTISMLLKQLTNDVRFISFYFMFHASHNGI